MGFGAPRSGPAYVVSLTQGRRCVWSGVCWALEWWWRLLMFYWRLSMAVVEQKGNPPPPRLKKKNPNTRAKITWVSQLAVGHADFTSSVWTRRPVLSPVTLINISVGVATYSTSSTFFLVHVWPNCKNSGQDFDLFECKRPEWDKMTPDIPNICNLLLSCRSWKGKWTLIFMRNTGKVCLCAHGSSTRPHVCANQSKTKEEEYRRNQWYDKWDIRWNRFPFYEAPSRVLADICCNCQGM